MWYKKTKPSVHRREGTAMRKKYSISVRKAGEPISKPITKWRIHQVCDTVKPLRVRRRFMGKRLDMAQVRATTVEVQQAVGRLARSRTAPARAVERARVVQAALDGETVEEMAVHLGLARHTIYLWLNRFQARGLAGLEDQPRSGRPATYTREQVGEIVATALTDPQTLDQPFSSWTLDRLVSYLSEQKGIAMKRSRVNEILLTEGLRWRQQETWFGERVDPAFAAKRGREKRSTFPHRRAVPWSVWTRWDRKRPRAGRGSGSS